MYSHKIIAMNHEQSYLIKDENVFYCIMILVMLLYEFI